MKRVIIAILLMAMPFVVMSQKKAIDAANNDTANWRYEIERVDLRGTGIVGDGKVVSVKVWSFSENPTVAQAQAYKNAVHGIIFKGIPMSGRVDGLNPICPNLSVEMLNADYFKAFFATGGPYMRFCANSGKGINTTPLKIDKKTYKVGVNVIVNVEGLRQELESAGVIGKLGEVSAPSPFASAGAVSSRKPSIMVVPSDVWMTKNGYMNEVELNGVKQQIPDYKRALSSNAELLVAITKFGEMMASRGFPLKDLAATLRSLQTQSTEDIFLSESEGGLAKSSLDLLRETAKADIEVHLTWIVNSQGPKRSLTANFQGLDTYTNKQIAAASGTGNPTYSAEIPVLLSEAVITRMDGFTNQLQMYFDDLFVNGREISFRCVRTNNSDINFNSKVGDMALKYIIRNWVKANTVNGQFSTTSFTENILNFEQVRIPANKEAMDWAMDLEMELDSKNISVETDTKGLGHAQVIIKGGM